MKKRNSKTIHLSDLSLREKIGQLIFIKPKGKNEDYIDDLKIGGIFLNKGTGNKKSDFKKIIDYYQNNSKIKLFIAADMEGYINPFKGFYNSKSFNQIKTKKEAHELGKEHGEIMKQIGFNVNFSPVTEMRNNVWPGRTFLGTFEDVREKISGYIKGLKEKNIKPTAKHFPGGNLVKNPHLVRYATKIYPEDIELFKQAIKQEVDFVMTGHAKVYGAINSNRKQVTISKEAISKLRKDLNFKGIIITDAVTMLGLRFSYLFNFKKAYPDLIKAGNDMILDTHIHSGFRRLKKRIEYLEKSVKKGKISEERINESVKRILEIKGYKVKN
ncbi:MAG TPA: glycoside hydrolase family 3 N-terminal domain-containing protein [Candidatus Nanoarchaeia archaeon]|nr:glycoside hydrolase family 3 N-terminal domain-containing protein [Candidatus Nanoarchaeia archaeon]